MSTFNAAQAKTILDYTVGVMAAEHNITRALIKSVPADQLDFRPNPESPTMGDLMLHLVQYEEHSINGICSGDFGPPLKKPEVVTPESVLAWDDEHFPKSLERLNGLSGEDLLRPITVYTSTRSGLELLSVYTGSLLQNRGKLAVYLGLTAPAALPASSSVEESADASGELSELELAAVAGGDSGISYTANPGSTFSTVIVVPTQYVPPIPTSNTSQFGVGALFGFSGSVSGGTVGAATGAAAAGGSLGFLGAIVPELLILGFI